MSHIQSADKVTSNSNRRMSDDWSLPLATTRGLVAGSRSCPPPPAAASNPFASLAPATSGRGGDGAATKHYEVPRELIEIARAKRGKEGRSGTLTPIAPRPTLELDASMRAYAASVSTPAASGSGRFEPVDFASTPDSLDAGVAQVAEGEPASSRALRAEDVRPRVAWGVRWSAWLLGMALSVIVYYAVRRLLGVAP